MEIPPLPTRAELAHELDQIAYWRSFVASRPANIHEPGGGFSCPMLASNRDKLVSVMMNVSNLLQRFLAQSEAEILELRPDVDEEGSEEESAS